MQRYKVSVIVPIYGVELYIERCARSLFEQTLDSIEYIFVNDCTQDNSVNILLNVVQDYPHRQNDIKIVNHDVNKGLPQARKTGILLAKGDYVINCDSDDWVDKNVYQMMWEEAYRKKKDIVFCNFYRSDGTDVSDVKRCFGDLNNKEQLIFTIINKGLYSLCGALVLRDVFVTNNILYPQENNGEDFALMIQLLFYTQNYSYLPNAYYYYYWHSESMSQNDKLDCILKRIKEYKANVNLLVDFFERNNFDEDLCKNVILVLKVICRANFSIRVNSLITYKIWKSIYPEIKLQDILLNTKIPTKYKLNFLTTKICIYPLLKQIQWSLKGRKW